MAEMNPALQQALSQAENSAKQSSGNPMDLNSIPGNIAKGFGQTPGLDKPVTSHQDKGIIGAIDDGKLMKSIAPVGDLDGLKAIQTMDNAAKINTDKSIADKTTNQGISSQSKG